MAAAGGFEAREALQGLLVGVGWACRARSASVGGRRSERDDGTAAGGSARGARTARGGEPRRVGERTSERGRQRRARGRERGRGGARDEQGMGLQERRSARRATARGRLAGAAALRARGGSCCDRSLGSRALGRPGSRCRSQVWGPRWWPAASFAQSFARSELDPGRATEDDGMTATRELLGRPAASSPPAAGGWAGTVEPRTSPTTAPELLEPASSDPHAGLQAEPHEDSWRSTAIGRAAGSELVVPNASRRWV